MASPNSLSSAYYTNSGLYQQHQHQRSTISRSGSRRASPAITNSANYNLNSTLGRATAPSLASKQLTAGDSSDDEVPEPKLSASVKALLGEDGLASSSPHLGSGSRRDALHDNNQWFKSIPQHEKPIRATSPRDRSTGSPAPRVVRITNSNPTSSTSSRRRHGSSPLSNYEHEPANSNDVKDVKDFVHDLITPAPRPRSVRISTSRGRTTRSSGSTSPAPQKWSSDRNSPFTGEHGSGDRSDYDQVPRFGASSVVRMRNGDDFGAQSSLRVKRLGRLTGTFLNGPARRGVLRRQSDEINDDPLTASNRESPDAAGNDAAPESGNERPEMHARNTAKISSSSPPPKVSWADQDPPGGINEQAGFKSVDVAPLARSYSRASSPKSYGSHSKSTPGSSSQGSSSKSSSGARERPAYNNSNNGIPSVAPLSVSRGQENEPPPMSSRVRPSSKGFNFLEKPEKVSVVYEDDKKKKEDNNIEAPSGGSPRRILGTKSNNTPHRPAPPPPPKMSVLETATATGGAATASHSRKRRNQVSVNHKPFTRLDCIGRGGSSRVYRVMAENYKIFALKKVNLEDVDSLTLAGYKGEIELLKKLENIDRVVRLFDWELNQDRHSLSVLMEIGESDLEKILTYRLNSEDAFLDVTFTRYFWKEMLECVQAVHDYNIVHSDLKPANFLLVQGRLKLIDFGIANAIQDNTVNVHREQQVGTPNYMSPEALVDSNASLGLPASVGKMMKLGKKSDVWSLGCILYKMVYGQPPFAKIPKYYERIMAIPNPRVPIDFPSFGIGGVQVPSGLVRTLKRCLQRDQTLRPTVEKLLDQRDQFLYPDTQIDGAVPVSQETLSRILTNVVNHCRIRGIPKDEELAGWPAGFFAKMKMALEEEDYQV